MWNRKSAQLKSVLQENCMCCDTCSGVSQQSLTCLCKVTASDRFSRNSLTPRLMALSKLKLYEQFSLRLQIYSPHQL